MSGAGKAGRRLGLLVAGATLGWLLANALGREYGWPARLSLVFDLAALGAFLWALVAGIRLWQGQRANRAEN